MFGLGASLNPIFSETLKRLAKENNVDTKNYRLKIKIIKEKGNPNPERKFYSMDTTNVVREETESNVFNTPLLETVRDMLLRELENQVDAVLKEGEKETIELKIAFDNKNNVKIYHLQDNKYVCIL